ncbi:LRR receptor-like serine threonine-protein kinase [Seminavis robusta]|uniref:LRR receptor-like serine threonine-protein kinase n=1 Tax=Seminavis robusta TaxID=568900 RepID=A0A9N8H369_9STRA|nr:LRR receptor-like serine threonine-protein kinase [Seminavis robusta]|eukprot:Sro52_g031230.1 LRR receptor-like serine threonine-protein kinase (790) ;mRNA; f:143217-145657
MEAKKHSPSQGHVLNGSPTLKGETQMVAKEDNCEEAAFLMKVVRERQSIRADQSHPVHPPPSTPGAYTARPGEQPQRVNAFSSANDLAKIPPVTLSRRCTTNGVSDDLVISKLVSLRAEAANNESALLVPPSESTKEVILPKRMQHGGDEEEEPVILQPVALRRGADRSPARISQPGAIAVFITGMMDTVEEAQTQTQDENVTEPAVNSTLRNVLAPMEINDDHDSGLAVANPVDEETQPDKLPLAKDYNAESQDRNREKRMKEFKTKVLLGVIVLLAIVLIVVAIVTPGKKKLEEDSETTVTPTEGPSHNPSLAPTSYSEYWLSLLPTTTVMTILENQDSPQSRAYDWLLEDIESSPFLSHDRIKQKFALAVLYFATGGDSWLKSNSWLNHTVHECDWFTQPAFARKHVISKTFPGFLAGFLEPPPSTNCDNDGLYLHLWLDQNNPDGSLPEELYMLTSLQTLSIDGRNLVGTISSLIGQLTNLNGLSYANSLMTGTIPTEVGLLSNMSILFFASNRLDGPIPSELWSLSKLDTISLGGQNLQGILPTELGTLSQLRWMIVDDGNLTGTIPTEVGQIETLEWLILNRNKFSGTIPSEIGMLANISMMSFRNNNMVGTLPSQLGLLTALTLLSGRSNQLSSQIPSEIGLLTNLVVTLNLQDNEFLTGTIPTELGRLTQLHFLEIQGNQLSGKIPSEFGGLSALDALNLASNNLSGSVPQELSALQGTLDTFALHGNPLLGGTLPDAICSLNGTCTKFRSKLDSCSGPQGLLFECTDLLCGCGCSCEDPN